MAYIPENMIEENNRLMELMCESDEELSVDEFVEKYASNEYKAYFKSQKEEKEKNFKNGVIVD